MQPWRCTIADGHLGIGAALAEPQPTAAEPRCWNHRFTNVLDAIPHKQQAQARTLLGAMPYAESQEAGERLQAQSTYAPATWLRKPWSGSPMTGTAWSPSTSSRVNIGVMCGPRTWWSPPFAAARLRTGAAKRFQKVDSATAISWKLLQVAEQTFRRLNAPELLPAVYAGATYVNGIKQHVTNQQEVAA